MGVARKKGKAGKKGGIVGKVGKAVKGAFGGGGAKGGGGGRRRRGPTYWANKVLVEKLKKRYNRLKYGSVR